MEQRNSAYTKLQKHLDQQAVGFPATRTDAELNVLKHIFTPQEAEIACCMSHKFKSLYWLRRLRSRLSEQIYSFLSASIRNCVTYYQIAKDHDCSLSTKS